MTRVSVRNLWIPLILSVGVSGGIAGPSALTFASPSLQSENSYDVVVIQNKQSGHVMDGDLTRGDSRGASVLQWEFNGQPQQFWKIELVGDLYCKISSKRTGRVLDMNLQSIGEDGTGVIQWDWNGQDQQLWMIIPVDDQFYKLVNKKSEKVLEISKSGAPQKGELIRQREWNGGDNQLWRIGKYESGSGQFSLAGISWSDLDPFYKKGKLRQTLRELDPTDKHSTFRGALRRVDPTNIDNGFQNFAELFAPVFLAGSEFMIRNNRNLVIASDAPSRLGSEWALQLLKEEFGALAFTVRVHHNANLLDHWTVAGQSLTQGSAGQTYGYDVYIPDTKPQRGSTSYLQLLCHEMQHSRQYRDFGGALGKFGWHYGYEYARAGFKYADNKLEREARQVSNTFIKNLDMRMRGLATAVEKARVGGRKIRHASYAPNGGWVVVYADGGAEWDSVPKPLSDTLLAKYKQGQKITNVNFAPNGSWACFYEGGGADWAQGVPETFKAAIGETPTTRFATFDRDGGWLLFSGQNGWSCNGVPADLLAILKQVRATETLVTASFSQDGGWFLATDKRSWWNSGLFGKDAGEVNKQVQTLAVSPLNDWIMILSDGGYRSFDCPFQAE